MKSARVVACLDGALLRYVRHSRPTPEQLLGFLGAGDMGKYYVLRKAGLLLESDGRVVLAPDHVTPDGRAFRFDNQLFLLDENVVLVFRGTGKEPP